MKFDVGSGFPQPYKVSLTHDAGGRVSLYYGGTRAQRCTVARHTDTRDVKQHPKCMEENKERKQQKGRNSDECPAGASRVVSSEATQSRAATAGPFASLRAPVPFPLSVPLRSVHNQTAGEVEWAGPNLRPRPFSPSFTRPHWPVSDATASLPPLAPRRRQLQQTPEMNRRGALLQHG